MEEVKVPTPLRNDIIVENPIFGKSETVEELKLIPQAKQESYIKENLSPLFERIVVVKKGPGVTSVEEGDIVCVSPDVIMRDGIPFDEGRVVLIGERSAIAKW